MSNKNINNNDNNDNNNNNKNNNNSNNNNSNNKNNNNNNHEVNCGPSRGSHQCDTVGKFSAHRVFVSRSRSQVLRQTVPHGIGALARILIEPLHSVVEPGV